MAETQENIKKTVLDNKEDCLGQIGSKTNKD